MSWEIWQVVEDVDEDTGEVKRPIERRMCECPDEATGNAWADGYRNMFWNGKCPEWIYYEVRPS